MTKHKLTPWYLILTILFLLYMFAVINRSWNVEAHELYNPLLASQNLPAPTKDPEPELPANVVETIRWAFKDKGEKVIKEAMMVAKCESGLKAEAYNDKNTNGSKDSGVFQINSVHAINPRFLKDFKVNIMVARKLYDEQGWNPWVCARKLGLTK